MTVVFDPLLQLKNRRSKLYKSLRVQLAKDRAERKLGLPEYQEWLAADKRQQDTLLRAAIHAANETIHDDEGLSPVEKVFSHQPGSLRYWRREIQSACEDEASTLWELRKGAKVCAV